MREDLDEIEKIYKNNISNIKEIRGEGLEINKIIDPNEGFYYEMRDMYNGKTESKYDYASLYYFMNKTADRGIIRYNNKGEFILPYGRYRNFNSQILTKEHSELLQKAEIYNEDYSKIFEMSNNDDFIFLNPPYDCIFSEYGNGNSFGEDKHRKLAEDFKNLSCPTLMIIGETPLINELYQGYIKAWYWRRNILKSKSRYLIIKNY